MITSPISTCQRGFTLIELSIVLVIVGLIIGGVLVGKDMVRQAELRATMTQIEKYNTAVSVFRSKFGGFPGDLRQSKTAAFGLFTFTGGAIGMGDGNGWIEGAHATDYSERTAIGEPLAFWQHLAETSLIEGSFGVSGNSIIVANTGAVTNDVVDIEESLPPAKLGRGMFVAVYAREGENFYEINAVTGIDTTGNYTASNPQLIPRDLYYIDSKVDDSMPNTGAITAAGGTVGQLGADPSAAPATPLPATSACVSAFPNTDATYRLDMTKPWCAMKWTFN